MAHREAELQRQLTETEIVKREAERQVIMAQAEAQVQRMAGLTEAEIMKAKGYSQKDVLQADVQKAYAEGIGNMGPAVSAGGGSGIIGDMMGLGVGMAAASAIAPQIGGMMQGFSMPAQTTSDSTTEETWDCICGQRKIIGRFCNNCGNKRPESVGADTWDCTCGMKGMVGNYCNNCGRKRGE